MSTFSFLEPTSCISARCTREKPVREKPVGGSTCAVVRSLSAPAATTISLPLATPRCWSRSARSDALLLDGSSHSIAARGSWAERAHRFASCVFECLPLTDACLIAAQDTDTGASARASSSSSSRKKMKFEEAAVDRIPAVQRDPHQQTVSSFAEREVQGNRQKLSVPVRWLFIEPLLGGRPFPRRAVLPNSWVGLTGKMACSVVSFVSECLCAS